MDEKPVEVSDAVWELAAEIVALADAELWGDGDGNYGIDWAAAQRAISLAIQAKIAAPPYQIGDDDGRKSGTVSRMRRPDERLAERGALATD